MDDTSNDLLRQLIEAQKEQTELLRKHVLPLWTRIRFSLLALFVLMTLMATGVGFTVLAIRSMNASPAVPQTATITVTAPDATLQATPSGSYKVWGQLRTGQEIPSLASPVVSP